MFSQKDLQTIATVFNKTVDEVSGAASSEDEKSLDLRLNGTVLSQEEQQRLKDSAEQQGKELRSKEIAKALGLTLDPGEKDPEKIAAKLLALKTTEMEEKYKNMTPSDEIVEAKQAIKDLENQNKKLSETLEKKETEIGEWEKKHITLLTENQEKERNNKILSSFPEKMATDKNDALLIINATTRFEKDENGKYVGKNSDGTTILNEAGKPETLENIVSSIVEKKGWINRGGGMGGGDFDHKNSGKKGGKTVEEADKIITEKYGANATSAQALKEFNELIAPVEA